MGGVAAFFGRPAVQFWSALISVFLDALGFVGLFGDSSKWWFLPATTLSAFFFLFLLALTLHRRVQLVEDERKPKFEMVFRPDMTSDPDSRPYYQVLEYGILPGNGMPMVHMEDRRYRVGLVNLSKADIPSVRVVLASCTPGGNFIHPGHRLLVMDSTPPEGERVLPVSANGEPTLFFDVVNENGHYDTTPSEFHFCYAIDSLAQSPVTFDLRYGESWEYEITLRAEGSGYSCQRSFKVWKEFRKGLVPAH